MKTRRKKLAVIISAIVLLLICSAILLWMKIGGDGENSELAPRAQMKNLRATSLSNKNLNLYLELEVFNPFPVTLSADSVFYEVSADGVKLFENTKKKIESVSAKDSSIITLEGEVNRSRMDSLLKAADEKGKDSAVYKLTGFIYTDRKLFTKIPISGSRTLPLFHFPVFDLKELKLDSIKFSGLYFTAFVNAENKNSFPFKSTEVQYRFYIADELVYESIKPDTLEIKPNKTAAELFPVTIKFKDARNAFVNYIKDKGDPDYKLEMRLKSNAEKEIAHEMIVDVTKTGKLKDLLKKEIQK